MFAVIPFVRLV